MMLRNRWIVLVSALLLGVVNAELAAQGKPQGKPQELRGERGASTERSTKEKERDGGSQVTVVFRDGDRAAFRNYFATHSMTARPLPPGIAKNLARGKPLPPGIAKRALPPDLLRLAPPRADGVSYEIVGDAVVATRAGVVIDILTGVFK